MDIQDLFNNSPGWQAFLKFKANLFEQDRNYYLMPEDIMLYIYSYGQVTTHTITLKMLKILDNMLDKSSEID